jgi:branched-chain amino acid transport system permease protein
MLAVGFTLIFGVARILNLAHGSFYALGAYSAYVLTTLAGVPLWLAALLSIAIVAVFSVLVEKILIRPLRSSQLGVLMISLATALVVEQALFLIFGSEYRNVPAFIDTKFNLFGVDVAGQRLLTLAVATVAIGGLYAFIQFTRLGSAILAISQDPLAAKYMGIPSDRIFSLVMAISAGLAALAGVMAAPIYQVNPTMGADLIIVVFAVVVIGGMGSILGSILTGVALGLVEGLTKVFYPEASSIVVFVIMAIMLMIRPAGLFGKEL